MANYGIRKSIGYVIYDADTGKIIKKYKSGCSLEVLKKFFEKRNCRPVKVAAFSKDETKSLLELKLKNN